MKLMEFEGKELFREAGIPVPENRTADNLEDLLKASEELGFPLVAKAQVLSGGRGKRGGIKTAEGAYEVEAFAGAMYEDGLTGEKVNKIMVEKSASIKQEFYLSVTANDKIGCPVMMASASGGVDIESVPAGDISVEEIDFSIGLQGFQVRRAIKKWGLGETQVRAIIAIALNLYKVYNKYDADLVEINPLVLTEDDEVIALDSKVIINDNALFRQQRFEKTEDRYDNKLEYKASIENLSYVKLDGNIGVLCTGAGLTLATLDLINDHGGSAANFLESGGANYANTYKGLQLVLSDPDVKVLLINTFGLVSRADVICRGLADSIKELKPTIPIIASIRGTGEEVARKIFREELKVEPYDNMPDAVKEAIRQARDQ